MHASVWEQAAVLAEAAYDWTKILDKDAVIPGIVACVAIVGGITLSIVRRVLKHRERIAMIEHGMDPDRPGATDA